MPYYLLARSPNDELYNMNMALSEEEARRYGDEGETVPVNALLVWTNAKELEDFRGFLTVEQGNPHSPFAGLIRDMRADRVDVLELSGDQLRNQLNTHNQEQFVCVDPGVEQRVVQTSEFLSELEG